MRHTRTAGDSDMRGPSLSDVSVRRRDCEAHAEYGVVIVMHNAFGKKQTRSYGDSSVQLRGKQKPRLGARWHHIARLYGGICAISTVIL